MSQNMISSDRFRTVFTSAVLCQLFPPPQTEVQKFFSPPWHLFRQSNFLNRSTCSKVTHAHTFFCHNGFFDFRAYLLLKYFQETIYFGLKGNFHVTSRLSSGILLLFVYYLFFPVFTNK